MYEIEGNKDIDDNENEFQDEILEDIEIEQNKKTDINNTENSRDISSSAVTLGIDSSVKSNMLNEFDHYENVQMP